MARTCIKCGYTRRDTDTAPDYECPACGVVYAKAEAALAQARPAPAVALPPRPAGPSPSQGTAAADALVRQLMAQAGERRGSSRYRGMAMVALVAFSLGFAAAAGLYAGAEKMRKKVAAGTPAAERCAR